VGLAFFSFRFSSALAKVRETVGSKFASNLSAIAHNRIVKSERVAGRSVEAGALRV
jgi:hypothetical protein